MTAPYESPTHSDAEASAALSEPDTFTPFGAPSPQRRERRTQRFVPWYRTRKGVAGIVAAILIGSLIAYVVINRDDQKYRPGPPSDPRATDEDGTAAWVSLLKSAGKDVRFIDKHGDKDSFSAGDAFVVLDPIYLTEGDAEIARAAATQRIPMVFGANSDPASEEMRLLGGWQTRMIYEDRREVSVTAGLGLPSSIETLAVGPGGVFVAPPMTTRTYGAPLLVGSATEPIAIRYQDGGTFWMLANTTMLRNSFLDQADNAAFALALVGDADTVYILTAAFRPDGSADTALSPDSNQNLFSALSDALKTFLILLLAAFLAYLWSRTVRLGRLNGPPPEFAPKRSGFVDAMARHLDRPDRLSSAAGPLQARAVTLLNQRGAALDPNADTAAVLAVAARLGLGDATGDVGGHDGQPPSGALIDQTIPADLAQLAGLVARLEKGESTVTKTDFEGPVLFGGAEETIH